jgi:intracellular sulfur oxidation DsrE/DsrF family protein
VLSRRKKEGLFSCGFVPSSSVTFTATVFSTYREIVMRKFLYSTEPFLFVLCVVGIATAALAAPVMHAGDSIHKVVIQVSSADAETQAMALNNVANLQSAYGGEKVAIELVAYGPGLSLLTSQSKEASRVEALAMKEVTFSACGNTMRKMQKKTGKEPPLLDGVKVVPSGVQRIIELQEKGFAYVRP